MNLILKLKTWQIFLLLMSPRILMLFFLNNPFYTDLLIGINPLLFFGFLILSYEFLRQFSQKKRPIQRILFFLFNLIFMYLFCTMLVNGYGLDFLETVLLMPFFCLMMGYILYILARKLNNAEKAHYLKSYGIFVYMLLFLLLPIGIWILVPQMKKLKELVRLN
ncbi:hypothetical protein [Emticicia agri]|uniref:Uncharacterized protein n=1 Tax=Emticicia agri TaxID=2492393 RepID=A0A4Q5LVC9_9BACT|nr:hypothetical protein [Emticicia agri]RYU93622.1 hypothetical protein EWM59_21040 [Emticicia agri]